MEIWVFTVLLKQRRHFILFATLPTALAVSLAGELITTAVVSAPNVQCSYQGKDYHTVMPAGKRTSSLK